ncbi:alpha/beta fold hydrolase, partial [Burkholderia ubonensis]|uniref:alpha/beta fold hydrolase n=1 Tax=Burkholderia ubonensis TaxID=101571 RepID=UPI000ABA0B68
QKAPLMQAYVAQRPDNGQWLLTLVKHHIVIDHVSLEIMLGEVAAILGGRTHELPAPIEFRAFVAQALNRVSPEEAEAFFRGQLSDVDETTAPFGVIDSATTGNTHALEVARAELAPALALRLRETARSMGVSPAVLFHVAWALVVARTSGRDDVVFGTVLSGRMQGDSGISSVLGLFINTLPIRIRLADVTLAGLVRNTHRALAALLPHEHAPLALAQRCSAVHAPAPLFTSMLNYRHTAAGIAQDWQGFELIEAEERTNYPLYFSVDDLGTFGFMLIAQAHRDIGAGRTMDIMLEVLTHVADTSNANCNTRGVSEAILSVGKRTVSQQKGLDFAYRASSPESIIDDGSLKPFDLIPAAHTLPANPTEELLASIASELLAVRNVGRNDNFFDLGADSLSLVQFIMRVRTLSGVALPLRLLFDSPSVAELAPYVERGISGKGAPASVTAGHCVRTDTGLNSDVCDHFNSAIPIQRGPRSETSVFCIPGAGANIACFVPLVAALGPEFSVYGLQPRGLDGQQAPFETVQAAAEHHVKAIQIAESRRRIALIGHSFGAWIAIEVQRLLIAAGRDVEPPILLDSSVPETDYEWQPESEASIVSRLVSILEKMASRDSRLTSDILERSSSDERIELVHSFMIESKLLPVRSSSETVVHLLNVFRSNLTARYFPREMLAGSAFAIFAIDNDETRPMTAWTDHIEKVTFAACHGNHMSLLSSPYAVGLANTIKRFWQDSRIRNA